MKVCNQALIWVPVHKLRKKGISKVLAVLIEKNGSIYCFLLLWKLITSSNVIG